MGVLRDLSDELEERVSGCCVEMDCGKEAAALDPSPHPILVQNQQNLCLDSIWGGLAGPSSVIH